MEQTDKKLIRERKKIAEKLGYVPEAIITNVPKSFFAENDLSPDAYLRWYLGMNQDDTRVFYHFISSIPKFEILDVYICWFGRVRVKARVAQFLKDHELTLPTVGGEVEKFERRDWMVTCGPVVKAPDTDEMIIRAGQGFRYTQPLF